MRVLVLAIVLSAFPAHADLYRWIDRETGSVKYSNTPPPWFGDPEKERNAPPVEVIRHRAPALPPKPAAPPEGAAARASAVAALEARWAELARSLAALPPGTDFSRAGAGVQQQVEAYRALGAELERLDPEGRQRRLALEAGIFDTARRGQ
jgi:hypothetical protein